MRAFHLSFRSFILWLKRLYGALMIEADSAVLCVQCPHCFISRVVTAKAERSIAKFRLSKYPVSHLQVQFNSYCWNIIIFPKGMNLFHDCIKQFDLFRQRLTWPGSNHFCGTDLKWISCHWSKHAKTKRALCFATVGLLFMLCPNPGSFMFIVNVLTKPGSQQLADFPPTGPPSFQKQQLEQFPLMELFHGSGLRFLKSFYFKQWKCNTLLTSFLPYFHLFFFPEL